MNISYLHIASTTLIWTLSNELKSPKPGAHYRYKLSNIAFYHVKKTIEALPTSEQYTTEWVYVAFTHTYVTSEKKSTANEQNITESSLMLAFKILNSVLILLLN